MESGRRAATDDTVGVYERVLGIGGLDDVDCRDFLALIGMVAANAAVASELTASLAGNDPVLRVNAAGILAKLPGQHEAARVSAALRRDDSMRGRYMTAVVARVCGVDWQSAEHLAGRPTAFRQPGLAARQFAREVVNERDAGARWCSAAMLQALSLSPMIGR